MINLLVNNLSKSYEIGKSIFSNINFEINSNEVLAISGHNGSGKTTLMKCLAGLLKTTDGSIEYKIDGEEIKSGEIIKHSAYVSPYLNLYEEFTPEELIKLTMEMRGEALNKAYALDLLREFALLDRVRDEISSFSSGMKQRMKYILALIHKPKILFLDESMSNLDEDGIQSVFKVIKEFHSENKLVILASNDERDLSLASKIISIPDYK